MPGQKSPDPPTIKAGKGQGLGQGSYCSSLGPLGNRSLNMDKEGMLRKPHPAQREVTCGEYTYELGGCPGSTTYGMSLWWLQLKQGKQPSPNSLN